MDRVSPPVSMAPERLDNGSVFSLLTASPSGLCPGGPGKPALPTIPALRGHASRPTSLP
jgi:hypothetical protein